MSIHLSQIAEAATRSRVALARDLCESLEGIRVTGTTILDVREMTISRLDKEELTVQRVYVEAADSAELKTVGWVANEGIDCCLVCARKFSSFYWKHHCRTCGLIVCSACTIGKFSIEGRTDVGPQRMCKSCNSTVKFIFILYLIPSLLSENLCPHRTQKDKTVALKDNTQWGKSISTATGDGGGVLAMELTGEAAPAPATPVIAPPSTPASTSRAVQPSTASRTPAQPPAAEMVAVSPGGMKPSPVNGKNKMCDKLQTSSPND